MATHRTIPVIAIVGGIGSGKSAVARSVVDSREVEIIDGDRTGHAVLGQADVQREILDRFGELVFTDDNQINRLALGRLVFGPGVECRQARADLERIVHPRIRDAFVERINRLRSEGRVQAILLDAAVLLEAGWDDLCDTVVYVDTSDEARLSRVMEGRGWSQSELESREKSQMPLAEKRQAAEFVVDNNQTLEHSRQQLEKILDQITLQSEEKSS